MKYLKSIIIAVLSFALVVPAYADNQVIDSLIGGAIGGAAGNQIGKGRGKQAATVAGALAGAWLGGTIGDDSERRHREQLRSQGYMTSAERNELERNASYQQRPAPAYREPVRQYSQPEYYEHRPVRQAAPVSNCDEEYYKGEYNPDLAQAFCRGQAQRERIEQARMQRLRAQMADQAYQEGLQGR